MLQLERALRRESALWLRGAIREASSPKRELFQQLYAQKQFLITIFMPGHRYTHVKAALGQRESVTAAVTCPGGSDKELWSF
jgi:hypothetical protein